jgi:OOP family OmpA-OmpF porin
MKNILSLLLIILLSFNAYSQKVIDSASTKKIKLNRWSIDASFGSSRGIRPYNDGYFSTENDKFLGEVNLNSVSFGARYYVNKYVTFKSDFAFDRFLPTNNKSKDFDVAQYRLSIQTMFNINMLFGLNEFSKFKLQPHLGLNIASLKTIKSSQNQAIGFPKSSQNQAIGSPDHIIGMIFGLTTSYNITSKTNLFLDLSLINNFRQHHTWDGNVSDETNNLTGQMSSISFGISYKLGKPIINDEKDELKKQEEAKNRELEKRITDVESKLIDTDNDGVPDNLDQEKNSLENAVVDSKGIMIDKNKNNIPDEVEKYLDISNGVAKGSNINNKQDSYEDILKKSIDEGYICVFFETGKSVYKSSSKDSINYILTFLITNPDAKLDLIGYTDDKGSDESNQKLGFNRANSVRETLIKLGIEPYRLKAISAGEYQSYNPSDKETRSFVRKVIFRVK